jgi:hypothetical protein
MSVDWQRLEHEVARIHTRYQVEVIEALSLCPWAKPARQAGKVQLLVSFMSEPDQAACLTAIDQVMADAHTEIGMLAFPALALERLPFAHFASALRAADEARHARGASVYAIADFHPHADPDLTTPERLVPWLRSAPDPMLQIVRSQVLADVRQSESHGTSFVDPSQLDWRQLTTLPSAPPPLAAKVAAHNLRTVQRLGVAPVARTIAAVLEDRDRSYAALGLSMPQWSRVARARADSNKTEKAET